MFNDRDLDNSSTEIYVIFLTDVRGLNIFALTYFKKQFKKKNSKLHYRSSSKPERTLNVYRKVPFKPTSTV